MATLILKSRCKLNNNFARIFHDQQCLYIKMSRSSGLSITLKILQLVSQSLQPIIPFKLDEWNVRKSSVLLSNLVIFSINPQIACVAALIYKKLTDNRARMTLRINQKTLNEWKLLENVTWSQEGNDFSVFTYAGYTFIIAVCLLER